jgi:hypothetical protein
MPFMRFWSSGQGSSENPFYMARWPELLTKEQADYAEQLECYDEGRRG